MSVLPHTLPEAVPVNLDPTLYELSRADTSRFQKIKRAVWDEIARLVSDDEHNLNNRFDVAAALNERKIATPTGGKWHAATVIRVQKRIAEGHSVCCGAV